MEFNVLSAFKGIEKEAINPFNPNEVGTSLFLNGGMGQKIKENMEKHAKKAGMDRRNFFRSSIGHKDTDNLLRSNVVRENAGDGILFREELPGMGGDRNRIESNTIEDNGAAGIRIRGPTSDNRLIGNIIRESRQGEGRRQTIGVAIEAASGDNQLERNRIDADEPVRDGRRADPAPSPPGRR
jgi:parallel beta-helix repeat protein